MRTILYNPIKYNPQTYQYDTSLLQWLIFKILLLWNDNYTNNRYQIENESTVLLISNEITFDDAALVSLVLVKQSLKIDNTKSIQNQIQILTLPGHSESTNSGNPYDTIHNYLHNAMSPYFEAFVSKKGLTSKDDQDQKTGVPVTKKKLAELELALLHLQHNIEIPDIHLRIHSKIKVHFDEIQGK